MLSAKELFPRVLTTSSDFDPSLDITVSTEKLRGRLQQEKLGEMAIKECESIMLLELSELHNHLKSLQQKHILLLDRLRQLEVDFLLIIFSEILS